ncbi:hypothetical protein Tco_0186133 [Tanacetum coccineum]
MGVLHACWTRTRVEERKTSKVVKPSKKPISTDASKVDDAPKQSSLNDLANAKKPPLTFDDLMSTPIDFSAFSMNRLKISKLTKADLVGPVYNLLKGTCKTCVELEYNIEECYRALFNQLDSNNPEGNRCPYDLSKPFPLNKYRGISHWGPKRQRFYGYLINKVSRHDAYSTMRILSVTSVTVDKWYGYGYLKEIVVRRADQKLYKFMESHFLRLHLNDIEDIMLLVVQNKHFNLEGDVIVDLAVALLAGKKDYEELREVGWWKGLWDWHQITAADNMTLSYLVLLIQVMSHKTNLVNM